MKAKFVDIHLSRVYILALVCKMAKYMKNIFAHYTRLTNSAANG